LHLWAKRSALRPNHAAAIARRTEISEMGGPLNTLVDICRAGNNRDRVAAANALLDRGFGRPVQAVDLVTIERKVHELAVDDLMTVAEVLEEVLLTPA
jgi:hypothetical protein